MSLQDPQVDEVFVIRGDWWKVTRRTKARVHLENTSDSLSYDRLTLRRWLDSWAPDIYPPRPLTDHEVETEKVDLSIPCKDADEDG